MTIPATQPPSNPSGYQIEFDHSEQFLRAISAITIDPAKSALNYLIPWLGAYVSNQMPIRIGDKIQASFLPEAAKVAAIQKIEQLKLAAGICRPINIYTSLDTRCSCYGGKFSISPPIVSVPISFLMVPGNSTFGPRIAEPSPPWKFTSDESCFFIARELCNIQSENILLRIAAKVIFVASLFFFCVAPISWLIGGALMAASTALYLYSERTIQGEIDASAIDVLTKHLKSRQRAEKAAFSALEKLQAQNIERRERNSFCRFYITSSGNNLLDLDHPFLTTRVATLKKKCAASAAAHA